MDNEIRRLKALADPGRLRVLALISSAAEICVCKLEEILRMPQPTVSRHLYKLKEAGWLAERRDGKWVHYRLSDDEETSWRTILDKVLFEINSASLILDDKNNLQNILGKDVMCD